MDGYTSGHVPGSGIADVLLAALAPQLLGVPADELEEAIRAGITSMLDEADEVVGPVCLPVWDTRLLGVSLN